MDLTQFQGIATCILPSTILAGGSETNKWVQDHDSDSAEITVSCTVPRTLPSGIITGRPRTELMSNSTIECKPQAQVKSTFG